MSAPLPAYEKLGAFYLGRPYDPAAGETLPEPLLYDSQDLLTHAVCVGMTGSGKTGLCIGLLEEAAIDGVPALIIDPKGDLGNLMLTFPELRGEDFEPWVDEGEASRKGLSAKDFAGEQAELWRKGLGEWDQDGERIRRLKQAAEVAIYTPGSEAGLPISILSSLGAPRKEVLEDADLFGDRVRTLVSSFLSLLGMEVDPVKSREHILVSTILSHCWQEGKAVDLPRLIQLIQNPPFKQIGVMDLETFFPGEDRFQLAITFNNLMAAPDMARWMIGSPLDIDQLLYAGAKGSKPRLAILSIAHLSDNERMSFVSLVLNELIGWMRSRAGSSSLRAILYMDEVFGYLPPVAAPPSKKPLLTLLKQARAYGLGVVLATQNPADLDYKALSNTGTWFLGRLQTERDKYRVMEGLEGLETSASGSFDKRRLEKTLAGLGKRVFLLHNVHESEPVLFHTRWAMSYLSGPLTRLQIKKLMDPHRAEEAAAPAAAEGAPAPGAAPAAARAAAPAAARRPVLPPGVPQVFLRAERGRPGELEYEPRLLGIATLHYTDAKKNVDHREQVALLLPFGDGGEVDWYEAEELAADRFDPDRDLESEPAGEAAWGDPPAAAAQEKSYRGWEKDLVDALYRSRRLELFKSPTFKEYSAAGESERDFRIRLADRAREMRDEAKEKLRKKYASKLRTMENRVRRTEERVEREAEQAKQQKMQTMISFGATALSALFGRKAVSRSSLGRATTAFRGVGRSMKEGQDVDRAAAELAAVREQHAELEAELQSELEALGDRFDPELEELETVSLRPKKSDVEVRRVALAWAPYHQGADGRPVPGWA